MADTLEFQMENGQCQIYKWKLEEVFLYLIHLTWRIGLELFDIIYKYSNFILLYLVLLTIVYAVYKAYCSPVLLIRSPPHSEVPKNRPVGDRIPPPYPNGWFALAESRELTVGKVTSVEALGHTFCVYRGEDGVARIVDAYCPHLGANLGIEGSVKGNCIECPFHHWRFGENGACTYIPDVQNIPKGISIKNWDCMEVDGAVWVWYDAEGRPPMWAVPPLPELSHWGYRGRNEFLISSHIRDIPENAADAAHLNCIHRLSFMTNIGRHLPFVNNIVGQHIWKTDWAKTDEPHVASMSIDQNYIILKCNAFPFDLRVKQIGPAHVRLHFNSIFGEAYVIQSVTPVGPMLQKVVHRIYSPTYNGIFGAILVLAEAYQFERDVVIWNNKTHVSSPPFVKADKPIRAFRDWFSQFYSEKSLSMRDAMSNPLDW